MPEIERQGDYYAKFPQPRAERLAAAFAAFVELADSGGPGTTRGLIAATELATTIAGRDLDEAVRVSRGDIRRVIEALGFVIN